MQVRQTVNQQALSALASELLPDDAFITKGPSFYMDRREVHATIEGLDDTKELEKQFFELSDFKLVINLVKAPKPGTETVATADVTGEKLEINTAYNLD